MTPTDILIIASRALAAAETLGNARCINLATQLDLAGFNVTLALPNPEIVPPMHFRVTASDAETMETLIRRHDTIISTGQEYTARQISKADHLQIFDVAEYRFDQLAEMDAGLQERLAFIFESADLILCGNLHQRDLWLGLACSRGAFGGETAQGRNPLEWFAVVPYGHPGHVPAHDESSSNGFHKNGKGLVWNGGYDELMDYPSAISAAVQLCQAGRETHITFLPPELDTPPQRAGWENARALADELDPRDAVAVRFASEDLNPYQRWHLISSATGVICCTKDAPDARFWPAPPLAEAVWLQVPVVCTRGSFMAFLAEELDFGLCCSPGDEEELALKIARLDDMSVQRTLKGNLAEVHSHFAWDKAVRPLLQFLQRPPQSLDKLTEPSSTWGRSVWRAVGRLFE
ncbi:MAG: glycosyltransferase [Candidatus Sumerlaeaceae bacterium]